MPRLTRTGRIVEEVAPPSLMMPNPWIVLQSILDSSDELNFDSPPVGGHYVSNTPVVDHPAGPDKRNVVSPYNPALPAITMEINEGGYLRLKQINLPNFVRGTYEKRLELGGYKLSLSSCNMPELNEYAIAHYKWYLMGDNQDKDNYPVNPGVFATFKCLQILAHHFSSCVVNNRPISEFMTECTNCHTPISITDVATGRYNSIYCATCSATRSNCIHCGDPYHGEYCPNCYEMSACAFCDIEIIGLRDNIILCQQHKDVKRVEIGSYSYKPDPFTYHHMM